MADTQATLTADNMRLRSVFVRGCVAMPAFNHPREKEGERDKNTNSILSPLESGTHDRQMTTATPPVVCSAWAEKTQ